MPAAFKLKGRRFGKLLVLSRCKEKKCNHVVWRVDCDCGTNFKVMAWRLGYGELNCCRACSMPQRCLTKRYPYEASSWRSMKTRCLDENHHGYKYWGGRGIKICERWLGPGGFVNFLLDMGRRPHGKTLDRKNPEGDYTPENCRWATAKTQVDNRRCNYTPEELKVLQEQVADIEKFEVELAPY